MPKTLKNIQIWVGSRFDKTKKITYMTDFEVGLELGLKLRIQ